MADTKHTTSRRAVAPPLEQTDLPVALEEDELEPLSADTFSTVLGTVERGGDWMVADHLQVRAILGNVKLDFRNADLPASGVVELDCEALFGEIELVVPRGAETDLDETSAILGEIRQREAQPRVRSFLRRLLGDDPIDEDDDPHRDGDGLLFVVRGRAFCGAIKVTSS